MVDIMRWNWIYGGPEQRSHMNVNNCKFHPFTRVFIVYAMVD